jgi:hypothetical protein
MARLDDRLDREFDPRTAKVLAKALDVHTVGELLRTTRAATSSGAS